MKAFWTLACALLVAAAWSTAARAGEPRPQEAYPQIRVGVVRIEEVIEELDYIKEQRERLEQAYAEDRAEIMRLRDAITAAQTALRDNPLLTPESPRFKKEALKIEGMRVDLQQAVQEFETETLKDRAEFYKSVYQQFQRAVNAYAQHYDLDLVITAPNSELSEEVENSDNPDRIQQEILLRWVQYLSPRVDITPQIIEMMNREYRQRRAEGAGGL